MRPLLPKSDGARLGFRYAALAIVILYTISKVFGSSSSATMNNAHTLRSDGVALRASIQVDPPVHTGHERGY